MAVTAAQLKQVIDIPLDVQDSDLAPFLTAAALIRSEDLAGSGLSSGRLDQIELYLAAHFATYKFEYGGMESSRQGESADSYHRISDSFAGLNMTRYGQMVLQLDTSGTLQATMSAKKAKFSVVRSAQPRNTSFGWDY